MKQIAALVLAATLAATPALSQDDGSDTLRDGFNLFSEGTRMILEGLAQEMRPLLDEARPFLEEDVLPFMERLGSLIDDLSAYEMPERLPNGDILIRRSPDAPPLPEADPQTDPAVDPEAPAGDVEL